MNDAYKPDAVFSPDGRRIEGAREWLKELALAIPNVAKLLGRLAADPRVPQGAKRLAGVVAAYLVSPVDLIPDFIPIIGRTDDVLLAAYAVNYLIKSAGEHVVRDHWDGADEVLDILVDTVDVISHAMPRSLRLALGRLGRLQIFRR